MPRKAQLLKKASKDLIRSKEEANPPRIEVATLPQTLIKIDLSTQWPRPEKALILRKD
jgi:hypothetical protein